MYLEYYGLRIKPFQISTDPAFLWLGEKHKEALAALTYGIIDNKGFLLLTGDVGTGKTTLINALINSLKEDIIVAHIPDPALSQMDFYTVMAHALGLEKDFNTKAEFILHLEKFLNQAHNKGKKVLLIIDEAQRLTHELMEEIRLISNIERQETKLINIFFVGQPEFNDILLKEENRALRQRITVNYHIDPLDRQETENYINHRLKVAGRRDTLFTKKAIKRIYTFSSGFPRLINVICDYALLTGFAKEEEIITDRIIKECSEELKIRPRKGNILPSRDKNQESTGKKGISWSMGLIVILSLSFVLLVSYLLLTRLDMKNIWSTGTSFTVKVPFEIKEDRATEEITRPKNQDLTVKETKAQMEKREEQEKSQPSGKLVKGRVSGTPHGPVLPTTREDLRGQEVNSTKNMTEENLSSRDDEEGKAGEDRNDMPGETGEPSPVKAKEAAVESSASEVKKPISPPPQKTVIYFGFNSYNLREKDTEKLDKIARFMLTNPGMHLSITGYTDSYGNYNYNKMLAKIRADIVKSYLIAKGIKRKDIVSGGVVCATNGTGNMTRGREGRRVEILIKKE